MLKSERVEKYLEFVKECMERDGINVTVEYAHNHYMCVWFKFINPDKAYRNVMQSIAGDNELGILYDISRAINQVQNNA